ncbi:TRAP transporter substrate-binding protein DctP [Roseibium sp. MMSF_3544]|uniref:TRAP transporter substrate-binding protein DctP n=1 Tax=unclassified Roseibium TaxID=2629323 RepID=UPI00273E7D64|nr:TRAP transporter substrate-binding protein DctP [Roseibium sp. MMSF_3544]
MKTVLVSACSAILILGAVSTASAENLRIQSVVSAGSSANQQLEKFAENVGLMSGGRLTIEILPDGAVVDASETLDAIGKGLLDGHFASVGYFAGQDKAFAVLGHFMAGYETPDQFKMFYDQCGGKEMLGELYGEYGAHLVGTAFWQPEAIPSNIPLPGIGAMEGIKMRAPGGVVGSVFSAAGVSVVTLPGSEVFEALSSGLVDATDYSTLGTNLQAGLHEFAKHTIYPSITSMPAFEISFSSKKWDALDDDLKAIVEVAANQFATDLAQVTFLEDQEALGGMQDLGVTVHDWSVEDRQKFRALAAEAVKEYASDSGSAQKAYDLHIACMEKLNLL